MPEKVVVALDGGPASHSALDWVIERSHSVPIDLELTTVVDLGWAPPDVTAHFLPVYDRILLDAAERVSLAAPGLRVATVVRHGDPVDELIRGSLFADLLVVGTNKTGVLAGIVHGTLPLRLAAATRCPLVVVPVGWHRHPGPVVVGCDDETDERAIEFAALEAQRLSGTLQLILAWDVPATIATDFLGTGALYDTMQDANTTILNAARQKVHDNHPNLQILHRLVYGGPAVTMIDAAKDAELVVVGTHRRGVIAGMLLGSVGHDLLMNMACPVAIVPLPHDGPLDRLPELLSAV